MLTASEIMTPRPVTVRGSDRVSDAVQVLQSLEVRHLPVVNEQHELIGMLSDRDLRGLSVPVMVNADWLGTVQGALDATVWSLMTADPISIDLEADIAEVIDLMLDHKIGAVPVVDGDGKLAGIVSYVDVLRNIEVLEEASRPMTARA